MRINTKMGAVVLATIIAFTASVATTGQAWAQDVSQPTEETVTTMTPREEIRQAGLDAAAEVLGMTPDEVSDQLWGGKTLADLAEEANVPLGDVRAAVEAATIIARQERVKEVIGNLVENGRISQERADWILAGIDNGWFGLHRFTGSFDSLGRPGIGGRNLHR